MCFSVGLIVGGDYIVWRVIFLQIILCALSVTGSAFLVGIQGAISAGFGSMSCIIPNIVFALLLMWAGYSYQKFFTIFFFIGEMLKILGTIVILLLVSFWYSDLHWPSLLVAMAMVLQAGYLTLLFKTQA